MILLKEQIWNPGNIQLRYKIEGRAWVAIRHKVRRRVMNKIWPKLRGQFFNHVYTLLNKTELL